MIDLARDSLNTTLPRFSTRSRVRLELSERRVLLLSGDIAAIVFGQLLAFVVWAIATAQPTQSAWDWQFIVSALPLSLLWLCWLNVGDLYNLKIAGRAFAVVRWVLMGAVAIGVSYLLYFFVRAVPLASETAVPSLPPLRLAPVLGIVVVMVLLPAWRIVYGVVWGGPHLRRRMLIVGAGSAGVTLAQAAHEHAHVDLIGFVDDDPEKLGANLNGVPVLCGHDGLALLAASHAVDEVAIAISAGVSGSLFQAIMDCHERGISVIPMPLLYEQLTGRIAVEHIGSQWYVALPVSSPQGSVFFRGVKRIVDVMLGVLLFAILAVLFPFVAVAIKLSSNGPIFYRQQRLGRFGKPYELVKFRSMIQDAERDGLARWATKNDPRVTTFGKFMRKTRLDEIPQAINVLRGEMSIVGPRPERQQFFDKLQEDIPFYRTRLAAKPGITGWAQVSHGYGDTVDDALIKLQFDLYYLKHQSPLFDLNIVLRTIGVILRMKGH
jgi:exopolysaccharide biosynthesis polyprenyl glycosylphosphotransferase